MKRPAIISRPAYLLVLFVVLVILTSSNTAQEKVTIFLTPRESTKVEGCGFDTTIDPDRMVAEKNSAFIIDLLRRPRTNPLMGQEYHALVFDVASYDDDLAENVRFSLPRIGRHDVVALFLVPSNAQCNQLTLKNAADQSDLYLPVYIGSSAIPEEVFVSYQNLEPGIKNHFGMMVPKLCGAKVFMGHRRVATSRSESISFLFNFAFNAERQLQIDKTTSCTTKDDTEESLQKSEMIDTTTSFTFLLSVKNVDDTNVFLSSIVTKEESGKVSIIYVDPVFEASPKQKSADPSDIVDHSWPVVLNKTSTRSSFFILIKDDDDGNELMKLTFRPVGRSRKKRTINNNNGNNQVVVINSNAKAQLNLSPKLGELKVFTIPVGQGDSTLIECPNNHISIIDMGCQGGCTMNATEYGLQMKTFFPNGDYSNLKHVFFTHPDADHINFALTHTNGEPDGGFLHKISKKKTLTEIHFGEEAGWKNKKWFTNYFNHFNFKPTYKVVFHEKQGTSHPFTWHNKRDYGIDICSTKDWFIKIIASDVGKGPNERSMVMSLQMKSNQEIQKKMLFLGDFQGNTEYEILLEHYEDLIQDHEVLMVPHHGADTHGNADESFIQRVFANIETRHLIVSSALWSIHNHPRGNLLMVACDKSQNEFTDQNNGKPNANKNTIMGWFRRYKEVNIQNPYQTFYSKYADILAFSNDCGGHGFYQTTKVDFETSQKLAFTYQTTFSKDPQQKTKVLPLEAEMDGKLKHNPNTLSWEYTGKIVSLV